MLLTWEKVGLVPTWCEPSSSFSFSLDMRLEENTSSRVLLTDGRVLWDLSHPPTDEETPTGGAGEMEMDAGVALTATGMGGGGAGGFGALCLVDFVGAGGWDSTVSGSLVVMEVSCRKRM